MLCVLINAIVLPGQSGGGGQCNTEQEVGMGSVSTHESSRGVKAAAFIQEQHLLTLHTR